MELELFYWRDLEKKWSIFWREFWTNRGINNTWLNLFNWIGISYTFHMNKNQSKRTTRLTYGTPKAAANINWSDFCINRLHNILYLYHIKALTWSCFAYYLFKIAGIAKQLEFLKNVYTANRIIFLSANDFTINPFVWSGMKCSE